MLKEHDIAPNFTAFAVGGDWGNEATKLSLSDIHHRNILLYFYPKDLTSGCTKQAEGFRDRLAEFQRHDTQIIGVSKDSIKRHLKFIEAHQLNFPLISDEEVKLCQAYGVWVEKSMYGRKYMGIERSSFLINKEKKLVKIWSKVKVPNHVEDVLSTLQSFSI